MQNSPDSMGKDVFAYAKVTVITMYEILNIELHDEEWQLDYIDHDRQIARAIVFDDEKNLYFVRAVRDDDFGKAILIETAGGGVEQGESLWEAVRRELREELGVEVEILCKLGVVSDYYNLIHRHNISNYYLCKIVSFGSTNMTNEEINNFRLSTLKMGFQDAVREYEQCADTKLGRLVAKREVPVLMFAEKRISHYFQNQKETGNF